MIFLDTEACLLLIRGGSKRLDERVRSVPPRDVCISTVTRAELLYGLARKPNSSKLAELVNAFLAQVRSVAWSFEATAHYADIRAFLEARGDHVGNMDQMVAAHARSEAVPLVTGNAKRFRRIPGLEVLDWA
ncbi:MAG TPA: PIN domain-containing protein [Usitatibacter sp.]|nr:PIN domain-containing protein [Usitatibacter sp.]